MTDFERQQMEQMLSQLLTVAENRLYDFPPMYQQPLGALFRQMKEAGVNSLDTTQTLFLAIAFSNQTINVLRARLAESVIL